METFALDQVRRHPSRLAELSSLSRAIAEMAAGLSAFRKFIPADLVRLLLRQGRQRRGYRSGDICEWRDPSDCCLGTPKGSHMDYGQGMHVVACAWLIRRFIDRGARFKFVSGKGYAPSLGELRFDVFEAEVTHMGGVLERSHRTQPCADLTSRIRRPYYGNERNDLRVFPEILTSAVTRSACPKCGCQLRSIQRKYNAFKSR